VAKNFSVLEMMEAIGQNKKLKPGESECPNHPSKKAKFYCKTHELFICSQCLSSEHLGHEIEPAGPLLAKKHAMEQFDQANENNKKLEIDI